MKILKYQYEEYNTPSKTTPIWITDEFTMNDINLIVSPNATGKTRMVNSIKSLGQAISGNRKFSDGCWNVEFLHNEIKIDYKLDIINDLIVYEGFFINGIKKLERDSDGRGDIYIEKDNKFINFQIKKNKLAIIEKKDSLQHPYLKPLYDWAEKVILIQLNSLMRQKSIALNSKNLKSQQYLSMSEIFSNIALCYQLGIKEFPKIFKEAILEDIKNVGFDIEDIGLSATAKIKEEHPTPQKLKTLFVREIDLSNITSLYFMSEGMYRTISSIVLINYAILCSKPECLIIDDVGDGLDFKTSTELIQLLIKKAKSSSIQLLLTSNNRFVMNKVPLDYWIILERKGVKLRHYSKNNSEEAFNNFAILGLNNFDIFAMDLYKTEFD